MIYCSGLCNGIAWYLMVLMVWFLQSRSPIFFNEQADIIASGFAISVDSRAARSSSALKADVVGTVSKLSGNHRLQIAVDALNVGIGCVASPVGRLSRKLNRNVCVFSHGI